MPINAEPNQIDNQNQQNQTNQQQNGGQALAGSGNTGVGTTSTRLANYSSGTGNQSSGSGRFTNLQNYLNANKDAGANLGNKITSNIDNRYQKTEKETSDNAGNVRAGIEAEQSRIGEGNQFNSQIHDDPTKIANDNQGFGRFQQLKSGQNASADLQTNLQNTYDTAQSGIRGLNTDISNLGTAEGRGTLLRQTIKQPSYTNGQSNLDQLFLQAQNPASLLQKQRELGQKVGQFGTQLDTDYTNYGDQIKAVGTSADDMSKLLNGTLSTENSDFLKAQVDEATNLNTRRSGENTALDKYFTNGYNSLTDAEKSSVDSMLSSGGLANGMRTYNVLSAPGSYHGYTTTGKTDLSDADVVDQNDLSRYQALAKLTGLTPDQYKYTQVGNIGSDASILGDKLQQDVAAERTQLEGQLNRPVYSEHSNSGTDYNTNYLDLLKFQEGARPAGYIPAVDGQLAANVMPIFGRDINGTMAGVGTVNYGAQPNDAFNIGNFGGKFDGDVVTTGFDTQHLQQMLQNYLDELNTAGYNNGLGGVDPRVNIGTSK